MSEHDFYLSRTYSYLYDQEELSAYTDSSFIVNDYARLLLENETIPNSIKEIFDACDLVTVTTEELKNIYVENLNQNPLCLKNLKSLCLLLFFEIHCNKIILYEKKCLTLHVIKCKKI